MQVKITADLSPNRIPLNYLVSGDVFILLTKDPVPTSLSQVRDSGYYIYILVRHKDDNTHVLQHNNDNFKYLVLDRYNDYVCKLDAELVIKSIE